MPPLPVARNRLDQVSGSQASNVISEVFEVFTESAIRQRFVDMICLARLQVASLSVKFNVAPSGTNCSTVRVAPLTYVSGSKARHSLLNVFEGATSGKNAKRTVYRNIEYLAVPPRRYYRMSFVAKTAHSTDDSTVATMAPNSDTWSNQLQ